MKIFEPRLKAKEILIIADALANGNVIEYRYRKAELLKIDITLLFFILSNLFRQVHQTKTEIINQENSLIKLKLKALQKNRGYLQNIENQFNGLLQNKRYS